MRLELYHLQEFFIDEIVRLKAMCYELPEFKSNLDTLIHFRDRLKSALDTFNE